MKNVGRIRAPPVALARRSYQRPSVDYLLQWLNSSTSFFVARNPLERIVSAYRDKMSPDVGIQLYSDLAKAIIFKIRHKRAYGNEKPTFEEFIKFIVKEHSRDAEMDMHWQPVYKFCTPCHFNLSYILKMETFERDLKFVLEKAGIYNETSLRKDNVAANGQTSQEVTYSYLKLLPSELYKSLISVYKIDFDLMGYQVPSYESILADTIASRPNTTAYS